MTTLYDTLGVNEHASGEELKRAYRKAMMRWHPDRNAGNEAVAHAAFQEVKAAYAILSDPAQRREYDTIFAAEMRRWAKQHEGDVREHKVSEPREAHAQHGSGEVDPAERGRPEHDGPMHPKAARENAQGEDAARQSADNEQAERNAQANAQARAEARYAEMVALAMRFAGEGYNRDVVFGVLLGRQCDVFEAQRIADSVSAWHASETRASAGSGTERQGASAKFATAGAQTSAPASDTLDDVSDDLSGDASDELSGSVDHVKQAPARKTTRNAARKTTRKAAHTTAGHSAANEASHAASAGADKPPEAPHSAAHPGHAFSTLWYHFLNGLKL